MVIESLDSLPLDINLDLKKKKKNLDLCDFLKEDHLFHLQN